ncbi:prenyltransferase/squalene oxidase repeat-containing protein [Planctomycetes bacterium Pla163]
MSMEEAAAARDRAIDWLVRTQREDGGWGSSSIELFAESGFSVETYYAWQGASHGLAIMALQSAPSTPERLAAFERAIDWMCEQRLPQRGSDWDVDYSWSALYCFVAATRIAEDPRLAGTERLELLVQRGREWWGILERNETPSGGWAYYDDPPYTRRPKWATSFCTAAVAPAIERGMRLGWIEDPGHLERAIRVMERAALPNGAYSYNGSDAVPRAPVGESIDTVKGSLGRIQVCHWARRVLGEPSITNERLRWGLDQFFEHHVFLDQARMRPIPHEGFYANAGYFYLFAHYYAAEVIELLPEDEREAYHAQLRPHLVKCQREDGSVCDFLGSTYTVTGGTAYAALALGLGIARD